MVVLKFLFFLLCVQGSTLAQVSLQPLQEVHGDQSSPHKTPKEIVLTFWNVNGLRSWKSPEAVEHRQAIMEQLEKLGADVAILSEISGLEALKPLPYDHLASTQFKNASDETARVQQLGVLSRSRWSEGWSLDFSRLPDLPDSPPRGIVGVRFSLNQQRDLWMFGVHLKSNLGLQKYARFKRQRAIAEWIHWMKQLKLDPHKDWIVLGGDFNATPFHPAFEFESTFSILQDWGMVSAWQGNPPVTLHSNENAPALSTDHIFVSEALREMLREPAHAHPVPLKVSDHYPITLRIPASLEVENGF